MATLSRKRFSRRIIRRTVYQRPPDVVRRPAPASRVMRWRALLGSVPGQTLVKSIPGIAFVAAVATVGDYVWYTYGVRHSMTAGIIHGVVLLTAVGLVLGGSSGREFRGLPIGALAGIGGALSYYLLIAIMDGRTYGTAIPGAWMILWLLLAALDGRWLRAPRRRTWTEIAGRGLAAAVFGSVAFYLVMNTLWGRPPAEGRNYAVQFFAWAFAWAPGLLALTTGEGFKAIAVAELLARLDRGERPGILDVRSEGEFAKGHVPGVLQLPLDMQ